MKNANPVFICQSELPLTEALGNAIESYWIEQTKDTMLEGSKLLIVDIGLQIHPLLPAGWKEETLYSFLRRNNMNEFADWLKQQIEKEVIADESDQDITEFTG